jgi:hypothetical protein
MEKLSLIDEKDKKSGYDWKISVFGILGIFWSLAIGFLSCQTFQGGSVLGLHSFWWLLIFLSIFLINFIIESVFANSMRWLFLFLQSLFFGIGVYLSGNLMEFERIALAIIPLIFLFFGRQAIMHAEQDMIKIRWHRMVSRGTNIAITGILIFVVLCFGLFLWQKSSQGILITEEGVSKFLEPTNFIAKVIYKDFNWNMSFNQLSSGLAERSVKSMLDQPLSEISLERRGILESQLQETIKQTTQNTKKQLENILRMKIDENDSLSTIAYNWITKNISSLSELTRNGLIILVLLIVFLALRIIIPIISFIVRIITFLIYELFLATNFAMLTYEMKNKENAIFN